MVFESSGEQIDVPERALPSRFPSSDLTPDGLVGFAMPMPSGAAQGSFVVRDAAGTELASTGQRCFAPPGSGSDPCGAAGEGSGPMPTPVPPSAAPPAPASGLSVADQNRLRDSDVESLTIAAAAADAYRRETGSYDGFTMSVAGEREGAISWCEMPASDDITCAMGSNGDPIGNVTILTASGGDLLLATDPFTAGAACVARGERVDGDVHPFVADDPQELRDPQVCAVDALYDADTQWQLQRVAEATLDRAIRRDGMGSAQDLVAALADVPTEGTGVQADAAYSVENITVRDVTEEQALFVLGSRSGNVYCVVVHLNSERRFSYAQRDATAADQCDLGEWPDVGGLHGS